MRLHLLITALATLSTFSLVLGLGWIEPRAEMHLLQNESYTIMCTLNLTSREAKGLNSSALMFVVGDEPVTQGQVKILNSTTIQLSVTNAPEGHITYICKLDNHKGVGMRTVYVGHKPKPARRFWCRSANWNSLDCKFETEYNPLPTTYTLTYLVDSNIHRAYECSLEQELNNQWICSIKPYRQANEYYFFTLIMQNHRGNLTQLFRVNNFDSIVPELQGPCYVTNISSNRAHLNWSLSYKLSSLNRNFNFEVKLLSTFDRNVWKVVDSTKFKIGAKNTDYSLLLDALPYADTTYDVRIRARTNSSDTSDDLWSKNCSCLFKTLSREPDDPPETVIGGFEINPSGNIFLYWRGLPEWKHNAIKGFHYSVRQSGQLNDANQELNTTMPMLRLPGLPDATYIFEVRSANKHGPSRSSSKIFVPRKALRLPPPKIEKLLSDSGKFTLSWKQGEWRHGYKYSPVTSYTVFWCNSTSNSPNDCNGSIDFRYVGPDQYTFELTNASTTLNFAVAANWGNHSSGMVWAACTATQKTDIGKFGSRAVDIQSMQSTYITLQWKPECRDVVHIGYIVYYCPVIEREPDCGEPEKLINITDKYQYHSQINGLKPYTTYKIQVAMYSPTQMGPRSDPLYNTTLGAAPTPPRDLEVQTVTNTTITLSWKPPKHINSGQMSYEIVVNQNLTIPVNTNDLHEAKTRTLTDLMPFKKYEIYVRAYTVAFSEHSNTVQVWTMIGTPRDMKQPAARGSDSTDKHLSIQWAKPSIPAGCIEFYELRIDTIPKDRYLSKVFRHRSTSCQMIRPICGNDDTNNYEYSVRAINVVFPSFDSEANRFFTSEANCDEKYALLRKHHGTGEHTICETDDMPALDGQTNVTLLYSNWSSPMQQWCNHHTDQGSVILIVSITLLLSLFPALLMYVHCKRICGIKVVMPEGLTDLASHKATDSGFDSINGFMNGVGVLEKEKGTADCTMITNEQNEYLLSQHDTTVTADADDEGYCADNCSDNASFYDQESERLDYKEDDTKPMVVMDQAQQQQKPEKTATTLGGYKPVAPKQANGNGMLNNNGYITVSAMKPPPPVNEYMPNTMMGSRSTGYKELAKHANSNLGTNPISGYVTHKQLSDYGQTMK